MNTISMLHENTQLTLFLAGKKVSESLSKVGVEYGVDDGIQGRVEVAQPCDEDLNLQVNTIYKFLK